MSKEKLLEITNHITEEVTRFTIRWFLWLIVVLIVAFNRACFEYIKKDGQVSLRRLIALFVLALGSGIIGIFIVSLTDWEPLYKSGFVLIFTLCSFRLIDFLINIETKTYVEFFTNGFLAAIDSWRPGKKKKDE